MDWKCGLLNFREMKPADNETELFCNEVAAEFLIPKDEFVAAWANLKSFDGLARHFKVSPLVAARRALDVGYINKDVFFKFYNAYMLNVRAKKEAKKAAKETGGDFYANCDYRIGRPFAEAIARAAKVGRLLYRDAYKLTGLQGSTFDTYVLKLNKEIG